VCTRAMTIEAGNNRSPRSSLYCIVIEYSVKLPPIPGTGMKVFDPFHWVFSEEKERKERFPSVYTIHYYVKHWFQSHYLCRHCTFLWTVQNITVTWTICTQTATAFVYSWLLSFLCYSLMFTLCWIANQITRLRGVYDRFKVCTKVSRYLYYSMLFNLCHCSYLCISINICLLFVSIFSK